MTDKKMADNWIEKLPLDDDMQIDLLVDNELNESQRQRLLVFFDSEPKHWRTLALRFVESQMMGETTGQQSAVTIPAKVLTSTDHNSRASSRRHWNIAAVCLGLCLAFVVGMNFDGFKNGSGRDVVKTKTPKVEKARDVDQMNSADITIPQENDRSSSPTNVVVDSQTPQQSPLSAQPTQDENTSKHPRRATPILASNGFPVPMSRIKTASGKEAWKPRRRLSKSDELALHQAGFEVQRRIGFKRVRVGGSRLVVMPSRETQVVRRNRHRI